jgi:hydroxypyruvate reductase
MSGARLRKDALAIFRAGVKAVDPAAALKKHVQRHGHILTVGSRSYQLKDYDGIYVIGFGKASAAMAAPVEELLGTRLRSGIINVKYGHAVPLRRLLVNEAGHPVPDRAGLRGTRRIMELLGRTGENDLVIVLISGGGSALLPAPAPGLTLRDKQRTTRHLLESGAAIQEINAVRKHLSAVKGGRLSRLAYPSTVISLILSDVIDDSLESIASGPTAPDSTTFLDCLSILEKCGLNRKVPAAVLNHLKRGTQGQVEETPKPGDPIFTKTQNLIIGSNIQALLAAKGKADALRYNSLILSSFIEGETREIAALHAALAKEVLATGNPVRRPACLISGGETTVTICGRGLGGRNQEFALAAAIAIDGLENIVILSGGTDGTDGPTDAAGAIADGTTVSQARALGIDPERYLRENDSYHFFQQLGDLLMTGPTFTNVMDLRLVLVR